MSEKNQTTTYDSISEAARALCIDQSIISKYFTRNQKTPYKGRYILKLILDITSISPILRVCSG